MKWKRRSLGAKRSVALKDETRKLLANDFIREAKHSKWIANSVLVRKSNGKWCVCIDYSNLNCVWSKDCFPLSQIDQLIDNIFMEGGARDDAMQQLHRLTLRCDAHG